MKYFNEFLESTNIYSCNRYPEFEQWRHTINHEDKFMPFLYSYHLNAFIAGCYQIISPFSGVRLFSSFTMATRGGGHNNGKRGNTSLFILYGFSDIDGTLILLGTMDVFSWWSHLIVPSKNISSLLVPTDDSEWYHCPISIEVLSSFLQCRSNYQPILDKKVQRNVFLGTSESAGHAVWNDLSGLRSYYRQAAIRGFDLCAVRVSYSLLSSAISDNECRAMFGASYILEHSTLDISQTPLLFSGTVFKALDFVLDIHNLKKAVIAYWHLHKTTERSDWPPSLDLGHDSVGAKRQISQAPVVVWANIRSPLETKRRICANYAQIISEIATHLREQHNVSKLILVIDGWTGTTERDGYTSTVQDQHHELATALEKSCQDLFDSVVIAVGLSLMRKLLLASSDSRIISICQYGSGIIYGSVFANDIAIVMDTDPFKSVGAGNDALLGRVDNVRNCDLKLAYIKGVRDLAWNEHQDTYLQSLHSMISDGHLEDYAYTIPPQSVLHALEKCMHWKKGDDLTYIDASTHMTR